MKHVVCAALLVLLPFIAFAQEYTLTLDTSKVPVQCEVLGASNGYLYIQTPTTPMIVVSVASVKSLLQGRDEIAWKLQAGENIPFSPKAIAMMPSLKEEMMSANNANLIQQHQVEELRGIKNTLQIIAAFTLFSTGALIISAASAK